MDLSVNGWLKEICLQLAMLNEKTAAPVAPPIRRGPGKAA